MLQQHKFQDGTIALLISKLPSVSLTITTLWANSTDDKLVMFFLLFFSRKQNLAVHANVKSSFSGKIRKNISKCLLSKILPRMLGVKIISQR